MPVDLLLSYGRDRPAYYDRFTMQNLELFQRSKYKCGLCKNIFTPRVSFKAKIINGVTVDSPTVNCPKCNTRYHPEFKHNSYDAKIQFAPIIAWLRRQQGLDTTVPLHVGGRNYIAYQDKEFHLPAETEWLSEYDHPISGSIKHMIQEIGVDTPIVTESYYDEFNGWIAPHQYSQQELDYRETIYLKWIELIQGQNIATFTLEMKAEIKRQVSIVDMIDMHTMLLQVRTEMRDHEAYQRRTTIWVETFEIYPHPLALIHPKHKNHRYLFMVEYQQQVPSNQTILDKFELEGDTQLPLRKIDEGNYTVIRINPNQPTFVPFYNNFYSSDHLRTYRLLFMSN